MQQRTEGHFRGHDDAELFYQTWRSDSPKGTLVVTHGLSEHSDCYQLFAKGVSALQWDIYAWDLRGHGRSEGKRGLVMDFNHYCRDLEVFIDKVQREKSAQDSPVALIGHSMGGLISTRSLIDFPIKGIHALCLSAPAFGIALPVPYWKDKASYWLGRWTPRITLGGEIRYDRLSSDPEVLESYSRDTLRHNKVSPHLYLGMLDSFEHCTRLAPQLDLPVMMQLSAKDEIVSTPEAEKILELFSSKKKEKRIYQNSLHEIYNDIERETIYRDLMGFLQNL